MTDVPMLEFIERIIAENNKRRDELRAADQAIVQERMASADKALQLQAKEYERRMELLNNEAQRLERAAALTVSRDTWDGFQKEYAALEKRVATELADRSGRGKALPLVISVMGAVIAAAAFVITYLRH